MTARPQRIGPPTPEYWAALERWAAEVEPAIAEAERERLKLRTSALAARRLLNKALSTLTAIQKPAYFDLPMAYEVCRVLVETQDILEATYSKAIPLEGLVQLLHMYRDGQAATEFVIPGMGKMAKGGYFLDRVCSRRFLDLKWATRVGRIWSLTPTGVRAAERITEKWMEGYREWLPYWKKAWLNREAVLSEGLPDGLPVPKRAVGRPRKHPLPADRPKKKMGRPRKVVPEEAAPSAPTKD